MLVALLSLAYASSFLDAFRSFSTICRANRYKFESHQVTTEDNYILTLFRIPGKLTEKNTFPKPVVFLQHGLIDLADTWILNDNAPAFLLADEGYDVWLGNSRGSYHSLGHTTYNITDRKYWEFTWMHMADYDIPSTISYVLKSTGQEKLTYIGHSQGTLIMFAHLADHPDFMKNLNLFIALGPVGTVKNLEVNMLTSLSKYPIFDIFEHYQIFEFLPNLELNFLFYQVCLNFGKVCNDIIEYFADMHVEEVDNTERFPVILAHETGGTSVLNMKHWQQMINQPEYEVRRFDYGTLGNLKAYGTERPPVFEFQDIPGPVALFSGDLDKLADKEDVSWLRKNLKGVVFDKELRFGHATFMWGRDMSYFTEIVELIEEFS